MPVLRIEPGSRRVVGPTTHGNHKRGAREMRRTATIRRLILLTATALAMVACASPVWAATSFTVDRGDDPSAIDACTPAPDDCSMRQAISAANGAPGAD